MFYVDRMHVNRVYGMLPLKTERNKLLGSPRNIWKENIKMDIKERGFEVMDRGFLVVDRDKLQIPVTC